MDNPPPVDAIEEYQKIILLNSLLSSSATNRATHPVNLQKINLAHYSALFLETDDSRLGLRTNVQKVGARTSSARASSAHVIVI